MYKDQHSSCGSMDVITRGKSRDYSNWDEADGSCVFGPAWEFVSEVGASIQFGVKKKILFGIIICEFTGHSSDFFPSSS